MYNAEFPDTSKLLRLLHSFFVNTDPNGMPGTQALARLRGNDSIGGLYFFPRDKLISDRNKNDCNQFLRGASFSCECSLTFCSHYNV